MDSGRSSKKPSLEVYPRKRARHAILKYGNACVLSSGGGSAQVKTWWKPPLTRWRKFEKKLRLPFFRLKSWKGCYSQSRWTFFWRGFQWKKTLLAVTKYSFSSFSWAGNASAGMFLLTVLSVKWRQNKANGIKQQKQTTTNESKRGLKAYQPWQGPIRLIRPDKKEKEE